MNTTDERTRKQRQQAALTAIIDLIAEQGFAPTEREIADRTGVPLSTGHVTIGELVRGGYIRKPSRVSRGIQVLKPVIE